MGEDDFDFESFFLENFDETIESSERSHKTLAWHEMGHFIGNKIALRNGFNLGDITAVKFSDPARIFTDSIYSPAGKTIFCQDYYGCPNLCFDDAKDLERISNAVKNKIMTMYYILYLICGGFFNIYTIESKPSDQDFEDCYLDSEDEMDIYGFKARAGNDWSKVRRLAQIDRWDLENLKAFRKEVYLLFLDHNIFSGFQDLINDADIRFNSKMVEGEELKNLDNEILSILNQFNDAFREQLHGLIVSYSAKL